MDGGRAEAGAGVGAGLVLAPAGGLILLALGLVHPGVTGYHVLSLSCNYMASSSLIHRSLNLYQLYITFCDLK